MTTRILDGAGLARVLKLEVANEVAQLTARGLRPPGLAAVLVGADPASQIYVASKGKAAVKAGFESRTLELPGDVAPEELHARLDELTDDEAIDGILVQMPLPAGLSSRAALGRLNPGKDVDGLHDVNAGRLWLDEPGLFPATPLGIMELLARSGIELEGKTAVIVGRSHLVGKPMAALLLQKNATVTLCHSRTRDLASVTRQADVLIAAVGRLALIGPEHVKEGAVVVDVGIHRVDDPDKVEELFPGDEKRRATLERRGRIVTGDVDFHRVAPKCSAITPVPGGVGPLTVAMLLSNTLLASKRRQGVE